MFSLLCVKTTTIEGMVPQEEHDNYNIMARLLSLSFSRYWA